jgi:hypothetical protein
MAASTGGTSDFDNSLLKARSASIVLGVASFPLKNKKPNKIVLVAIVMLLKEFNNPGQNTKPLNYDNSLFKIFPAEPFIVTFLKQ